MNERAVIEGGRPVGNGRPVEVLGCRDLAERGLWDTLACCETCHSSETTSSARPGFPAGGGPCTATLGDGTMAEVCCEARGALSRSEAAGRPDRGKR